MKKVILCAGALMFGAVAFAQSNSSLVGQSGNHNQSDVDQQGLSNLSFVAQSGDHNSADVDQKAEYNEAFVVQRGSHNSAITGQNDDGLQGPAANFSKQYQSGNHNEAVISQDSPKWSRKRNSEWCSCAGSNWKRQ